MSTKSRRYKQGSRLGGGRLGGSSPHQKLESCLTFCQNLKYFLRDFLQPPVKFRQKLDLSAIFTLFLAESRIKISFPMKSRRKSIVIAFLVCYLPKSQMKRLYAEIFRLSAEFLAPPTLKNNREPWI
jgi:hypothetical protein